MSTPRAHYDVVIMGGGPGGATLGALLARRTKASIAIFDREIFPREHIGESLSYRVIPVLEASGALGPVLSSDCWLEKFGGYYAWDPERPAATFFEHHAWEADGVFRWAIHCNRAGFDAVLLDHARTCGVDVFEGVPIVGITREGPRHVVTLDDGRTITAEIVVEASGRQTSLLTRRKREHLSAFRNVAMWVHVVDGELAQALDGDWNFFRRLDKSPIGSFAFDDGWYWYIPVPREVDGQRVITHSLGLVTDPELLTEHRAELLHPERFVARARRVPLLGELIRRARPVSEAVRTATNYSMISERFCSYDEAWMLVGDSAYFVDPLFSSGVAFALHHAASASLAIQWALEHPNVESTRDLWWDYDHSWRRLASSFTLIIDQWYHAIAQAHPGSIYWTRAAQSRVVDLRERTFQAVVDTAVSPDLVRVLTREVDELADVLAQGPFAEARLLVQETNTTASRVQLVPGAVLRPGAVLGVGQSRGSYRPGEVPSADSLVARYWLDPIANGPSLPPMYAEPQRAMFFEHGTRRVIVPHHLDAPELLRRLQAHQGTLAELMGSLSVEQRSFLAELFEAGIMINAGA
jgi:flavin-dependent dehydrogenase